VIRAHSPYYILKVSARTDEFFLRYQVPKNVLFSELLRERSGFYPRVTWEEKHLFELKLSEYNKDYVGDY
jgi:hypothetical protein